MEKWFVASKRADFNKIGEVFHISPVTARLMRNRDLTTIEEMQRYLYGSLSDLYDPHLLKDADKGAEIITNICTFDSIKNITKKELIFPYKLMTWV